MKILVVCLAATLFACCCSYSYAQGDAASIRGRVYNDNDKPVANATAILLAADSSVLKSTPCDTLGQFKFQGINPGKYLLLVSKVGFSQSVTGPYAVVTGGLTDVNVHLMVARPQLQEVTISSQRPYIEVKPGRVVLNVQGSIVTEGNSVYDILRQAPGVKIDNNDKVSLIGRQSALVMLDGRPTNLSGEALTNYLQGMAGSGVQQIELITNPSAKYDASGAGVINIISKKGTAFGTNGTFVAGAGYGTFYKSNTSIVFNHRTAKFNVFGNFSYDGSKTFHQFDEDRLINFNNVPSEYNVDYYTTQKKYISNFKAGADYYLTDKQTLGVLVFGSISNNAYMKQNNLDISNNGKLDSAIYTNSALNRDIDNVNYDISYNGMVDKDGCNITADVLYNTVTRHSGEFIDNNFYNSAGAMYRPTLLQQNLSPSTIHNWVAKVDYIAPLSKTTKFETGVKYSWVQSNNDLVFGPFVNGAYQSDPKFSNTFLYRENVNSAYANYINNGKKFNIVAGLRLEQTNDMGNSVTLATVTKKNYLDLLPQVQITYKHDEKNEFTLSYNRSIQRPMYGDINPFLYYVDLYDYRSGNPNLLPEYTTKVELAHTYNATFTTAVYAQVTNGFYDFNDYLQNDTSKVAITTRKNFGNYYAYGIRFYAPVQFASWWDAVFNADISYQRIKAYPENGTLNKGTQDVLLSGTQTFKLSKRLTADLIGKYESPTFYGISNYKAAYHVDAAIAMQVAKNASLKLQALDIFNTDNTRSVAIYQSFNAHIVDKYETRMVKLSFTYRFGKSSVKGVKHQTANKDEQDRIGGN